MHPFGWMPVCWDGPQWMSGLFLWALGSGNRFWLLTLVLKRKVYMFVEFQIHEDQSVWLSNNWPALYPLKDIWGCVGICLTNLHVSQTWRRHLAAFLKVSCRGVLQEYRVSGLLIWVICSPHNNKHKPQTCSRCKLNSDRTELLIHLINFCGQNFSV